jgi:4a-hydroxytetrahydrobiopterin dehydratase
MSHGEADAMMGGVPQWKRTHEGRHLTRRFAFGDFKEAMTFVNGVAEIAEAEGHHPDICIHWNQVDLDLFTHKIDGLHENDFILAAKIDDIAGR